MPIENTSLINRKLPTERPPLKNLRGYQPITRGLTRKKYAARKQMVLSGRCAAPASFYRGTNVAIRNNLFEPVWYKPKGMHWARFERMGTGTLYDNAMNVCLKVGRVAVRLI